MNKLKEQHEHLKELEEAKWYILGEISNYQNAIDYGEADIINTTTKEDWKKMSITNEAGRKAYIRSIYESQYYGLMELKNVLRYVEMREKQIKRVINYYMKYSDENRG